MPLLETSRLLLRDFNETDLDALVELWRNEGFARFSGGAGLSREQTAGFLERVLVRVRASLPSQFAVVPREHGHLIGYCGFFLQNVDGVNELEIGYRLHPGFWGKGIATEAAQAVRDHAFADLGQRRVISLIHPDNTASRRVAEKTGLTLEKQTTFRGFPTLVFKLEQEQTEQV